MALRGYLRRSHAGSSICLYGWAARPGVGLGLRDGNGVREFPKEREIDAAWEERRMDEPDRCDAIGPRTSISFILFILPLPLPLPLPSPTPDRRRTVLPRSTRNNKTFGLMAAATKPFPEKIFPVFHFLFG